MLLTDDDLAGVQAAAHAMSPTLKAKALLLKAIDHIHTQQAMLNQSDDRAKALLRKRNVAVKVAVRYAGRATAAEAERDRLKARVAELESALRQHLTNNRACSIPIGAPGSQARLTWEDQAEADRVAAAALAQETKP